MSYSSRVYRQRNAHTHEEGQKDAFFGKQSDQDSPESQNSFFQTKLAVNKAGDKYEKEADSVADAVTNKNASGQVQQKKISSIQRLSTPAEDEKLGTNDARVEKDKEIQEKPIQKMGKDEEKKKPKKMTGDKKEEEDKTKVQKKDDPAEEDKKKKAGDEAEDPKRKKDKTMKAGSVQKKQEPGGAAASQQLSSKIESSSGKGKTLQPGTLQEMNSSFGADFSDVHVHDDNEAQNMNKELQAQAFTHGKDIYFNKGKYEPETKQGKNLLAHELTHVVQQNSD